MISLGVSMIVRDGAEILPACLASVQGLAQEIVVADTGSRDTSIAVAQGFGAKVIEIPWHENFAEARNLALAASRADWILSLDADEQLDVTAAERLPVLLADTRVAGYQVTIRNYVASRNERVWDQAPRSNDSLLPSAARYPAFVEHENVRLFRRRADVYFVGRVHESVGPRIRQIHGRLGKAAFAIHHFGFVLEQATKDKKNLVYREMGRRKVREAPTDWQAHFELGLLELEQFRNLPEALRLFARACSLNSRAGVAWFFHGLTCFRLSLFEDALEALQKAENCGHKTSPVAETRGDACYNLGQFAEARSAYEAALKREPGSAAVEAKLALALVRSGHADRGLKYLAELLATNPRVPELYEGLILSYVFLSRIREAAEIADQKLRHIPNLYVGDYLRAASLWAQLRDWPRTNKSLEEGLRSHPGSQELQRALKEAARALEPVL